MEYVVGVLMLGVVGLAAGLFLALRKRPDSGNALSDAVKAEFQSLSQEALTRAQDQFLTLADQRFTRQTEAGTRDLDTKKQLIDQQLEVMNTRLEQVSRLVNETEYKRQASFGQLTTHIQAIGQQTTNVTASTTTLREALSSSRTRGQWGERMADDIPRALGFVEGVNYYRQEVIEGVGSRPDFVFPLSGGLRVNMDGSSPSRTRLSFSARRRRVSGSGATAPSCAMCVRGSRK